MLKKERITSKALCEGRGGWSSPGMSSISGGNFSMIEASNPPSQISPFPSSPHHCYHLLSLPYHRTMLVCFQTAKVPNKRINIHQHIDSV